MKRTKKTAAKKSVPYRVIRLSEVDRSAFKSQRDKAGDTNELAVEKFVDDRLPKLVAALTSLGVRNHDGKRRPMRIPVPDVTLKALRKAANDTNLPAVLLLKVCLCGGSKRRG